MNNKDAKYSDYKVIIDFYIIFIFIIFYIIYWTYKVYSSEVLEIWLFLAINFGSYLFLYKQISPNLLSTISFINIY